MCYPFPDPPEMSLAPEVLVKGFNERGCFVCEGFGIPRPTLSWKRKGDDEMFLETNFEFSFSVETSNRGYNVTVSTMTLKNTGRDLEDTYICSGVNNVTNIIGTNEKIEGIFFIEGTTVVFNFLSTMKIDNYCFFSKTRGKGSWFRHYNWDSRERNNAGFRSSTCSPSCGS